jgi:DNA-directed RNA polymerase subunit beta
LTLDVVGELMKKAGIPVDGKVQLYDGETGEAFKEKTMV